MDLLNIVLRSECCQEDWMRSWVGPLYTTGMQSDIIGLLCSEGFY